MTAPDPFLEIADSCIARVESEGVSAIDELCRENPEHAERLRRVLHNLVRVGLVGGDEPPERIGRYRLVRRIGAGGMGIVWEAIDERLARRVALKILPGHVLGEGARRRFEREVAAVTAIDHPGVCTVFEAGDVDGTPFLAMRLIDGETLAAHLARDRRRAQTDGSSSERDRIAWCVATVAKVARAVAAAHAARVVHRDLKPHNVMIDSRREPVVLDFGLARTLDEGEGLTRSGDHPGTPAYMAPEQVDPRGGSVGVHTDVYGLGAMLYECLTLRPPFDGTSREGVFRAILHDDPVSVRRSNRAVGRDLQVVVERALDKNPSRRFASAADFADELERVLRHEPIRSRPAGVLLRTRRFAQRYPAAATVFVVLAAALGVTGLLLGKVAQARAELREHALSSLAVEVLAEDPVLAAKLAREAVRSDPRLEHIARLQRTLGEIHERWRFDIPEARQLRRVEWSPDGSRLLVVADHGVGPRLLDATGQELARIEVRCAHDAAAWSRDGQGIAVGGFDGRVRVFDTEGRAIGDPLEFGQLIESVRWSPDGSRLVAGGQEGRATVWDVGSGKAIATCDPVEGPVFRVEFADRTRVVLAEGTGLERRSPSNGYSVLLWDPTADTVRTLGRHAHTAWSIVRTSDRIATGSEDGAVRMWDHAGELRGVRAVDGEVYSLDPAPDGRHFVAATSNSGVLVLDEDANVIASWRTQPDAAVARATFSPDGQLVVTAGWNQRVQVWRWRTRDLVLSLRGHLNGVTHAAFSPDGRSIASVGWDGTVRCFGFAPLGQRVRRGYSMGAYRAEALADGSVLAVSRGGELRHESAEGTEILASGLEMPLRLRVRGDGAVFALCSGTELIVGTVRSTKRVHLQGEVRDVAFGRDGVPYVATAAEVIEVGADGTLLDRLEIGRECTRIAVGAESPVLVAGYETGVVRVWDLVGRRARGEWRAHAARVTDVRLTADGSEVLTASEDGTAALWRVRDRAWLRSFVGHRSGVIAAAFSPDAGQRTIATASNDDTTRLWDRARGTCIAVLRGHARGVPDVCFLPGGEELVTASADGTLRWWPLTVGGVLTNAKACDLAELTDEERARFPQLFR